jgi:septum site-determining protein MinD
MGKIITVTGVTDSAVRYFTGLNLALAIAGHLRAPAAFIDLSFQGNEMELMHGQEPGKNIRDLTILLDSMDPAMLKSYIPITKWGIAVIDGIDRSAKSGIEPTALAAILALVSSTYPYTIVNAGRAPDPHLTSIVDSSDLILMLTPPELLSLRVLTHFLDSMKALHFTGNRFLAVMTKVRGVTSYLPREHSERFLAGGSSLELIYEPEIMVSSINTGQSPLITVPHSTFSRSIKSISDHLLKDATYPVREPGTRAQVTAVHETAALSAGAVPDALRLLKARIHAGLIARLNTTTIPGGANALRESTRAAIEALLANEDAALSRDERARLVEELLNEALGLGCLEDFLNDPEVTEVMVNGPETIYVEKKGKIFPTGARFASAAQLMTVIDRIVSPLGRRVDEASPLVDARLADGSRVNVIIPPLAIEGPAITIRKFPKQNFSCDDFVALGAASKAMMEFLRICILLRKNIVISGGTGSGKTTLLNIVSAFIPPHERIITLEDSAELRLPQDHVVRLESRRPSVEGTGEVPIRHLLVNALRMRPDRIIVGECRSGEALDMLQAMNTGHDGSLTTIHSNSPRDAVHRISTLALMSGTELPEKAVREQIASAIHIIVQLSRLPDGSRKIVDIAEIRGLADDGLILQTLFSYSMTGIADGKVKGYFAAAGTPPLFEKDIRTHGIACTPDLFAKGRTS